MVIIFAAPGDGLAADVREKMDEKGRECRVIPPPGPGSSFKFSWELPAPAPARIEWDGQRFPVDKIRGVLVRALPEPPQEISADSDRDYLCIEWHAALLGWLQSVTAAVVNRPKPGRSLRLPNLCAHSEKFRTVGLQLAPVLVTDSVSEARGFFRRCGRSVLVMPACAGRTVRVEDEEALLGGACCLIAVPDGVWRRIHVVDGEAFAEIIGDDGRQLSAGDALPESLARRCCTLVKLLDLDFLELLVVSGNGGDVVLGAEDLPGAVFNNAVSRDGVAGALIRILDAPRRETPQ